MKHRFLAGWVLLAGFFLAPKGALACAVCFGNPGSKISQGIFAAIYLLLGVVVFVLGGIVATAWTWVKRAKNENRSL